MSHGLILHDNTEENTVKITTQETSIFWLSFAMPVYLCPNYLLFKYRFSITKNISRVYPVGVKEANTKKGFCHFMNQWSFWYLQSVHLNGPKSSEHVFDLGEVFVLFCYVDHPFPACPPYFLPPASCLPTWLPHRCSLSSHSPYPPQNQCTGEKKFQVEFNTNITMVNKNYIHIYSMSYFGRLFFKRLTVWFWFICFTWSMMIL